MLLVTQVCQSIAEGRRKESILTINGNTHLAPGFHPLHRARHSTPSSSLPATEGSKPVHRTEGWLLSLPAPVSGVRHDAGRCRQDGSPWHAPLPLPGLARSPALTLAGPPKVTGRIHLYSAVGKYWR